MTQVEAIFRHGKFEPVEPVPFTEESRVVLKIKSADKSTSAEEALAWMRRVRKIREQIKAREGESLKSWLAETRAMHAEFLSQHGPLPDSTLDIAEDRMR